MPDQPVQQHRILRADDLLERSQLRDPRRGERRSSAAVTGRRRWRPAAPASRRRESRASGALRFRQAGGAPTSAKPTPPVGSPSSPAHCTTTSPGSKRPAADTTRIDEDRSRSLQSAGSRYHAERSTAGCWVPLRQLPITGVRAGSRLKGSRARDPLTPAAAVVPPSVPAWPLVASCRPARSRRSCSTCPGRPSLRRRRGWWGCRSGRTLRWWSAKRVADRRANGRQHACVGVLFDHHVVGQAAPLAGERAQIGAAVRPGRPQVGHGEGQCEHFEDDEQPGGNCQRRLDDPCQASAIPIGW